ncbi:MAG: ATP-binding protein, partial [Desulfuromonadales bacterium]|nr:ATP-binding protein [Desulfuromonadales bacterium]
ADEKQIQQVVLNISINAIQAMQAGGSLMLTTGLVERHGLSVVQLKISDTGKGIPQEELDKIFVPFYTTKTQGTGLGLPICKQLLEQHQGTISVESRLGEGTTFTIELPVTAGQALGLEGVESA